MTSGFAFQALPALDVTRIDNSQHDRIISWYSNDLPFYTFTPSLSLEQFQVYNQMQKSKSLPCLPSLYYFQTSATCSAVVWELDIQVFHRSTARFLLMTWVDFSFVLIVFTQLSHIYYNTVYSKKASSVLILEEVNCGKLFDLQKYHTEFHLEVICHRH